MPNKTLAKAITVVILTLFFGMQLVGLATANPVPYPATPNQDKPTLIIESPKNNTAINEGSVYLNFTVTKPDSWNDPQWFMPYIGQVASVKAYLDGNSLDYEYNHSGSYSVKLNLNQSAPGLHALNVTVLSYTYYRGPAYNGSHILSGIQSTGGPVYQYPMVVSDVVYLTVEQLEENASANASSSIDAGYWLNQTFHVTIVAVAALVIVTTLVVYFKRHKTKVA